MNTKDRAQTRIPTGKLSRSATAGAAAAKIGAKRLGLLAKKPFLSESRFESARRDHDDDAARTLFEALTQLRGSALKIAQILSLEMGLLPEAYRKELQKAHYQVPPLNRAVVRRLLVSELGRAPEQVFAEFEPEAFAAASLGQVHRARTAQGERLAVKVQYPGIASALKSDMELVKRALPRLLKSDYVANATREIERRLIEEIEYGVELEQTRWFGAHVRTPDVVIPAVYPEYSTDLVLATELLEGRHLDQWLETRPSQAERDRVAQILWDLFLETFFELCRIHADPNPGNYLFREDGTVGLIDFGSVKAFERGFTADIGRMWDAHIRGDDAAVKELYLRFGISKAGFEEIYTSHLRPFGHWLALPFRSEYFDFGLNRDYCEGGLKHIQATLRRRAIEGFTTENIMFDRNVHGLYRIFTAMGAKVRLRNRHFGSQ